MSGTVRRILVPMDFSASSLAALEYAAEFARAFQAEVALLHVVEREEMDAEREQTPVRAEAAPCGCRHEVADVQPAAEGLRRRGIVVRPCLVEGEAVAQIIKVACDEGADVIVMGAHGREGSPRTWLGTTIERVMRRAPCPVVAVREDHRLAVFEPGDETRVRAGTVDRP